MAVKIKDRETADGKRLSQALKELKELQVRIGVQAGASYPDGTSVVDVAMWNELGTVHIPSRPFIRNSVDTHADEINADLEKAAKSLVNGSSVEGILNRLGERHTNRMVKEIKNGDFVPNSPATVKRKKSDKPLIDTGNLWQSIHHIIAKKGEYD